MSIARGGATLFLAAAFAILAAGTVSAQSEGDFKGLVTPPAEKLIVAGGGVDMRTGRYAFSQTDLSIGDGGTGSLALTRQTPSGTYDHIDAFGNFSHNFEIMLTEKRVDVARSNFQHGSGQDYRISVHYAGRADTFQAQYNPSYQGGFTQLSHRENVALTSVGDRNGASVVYTYQAPDGTLVVFRPLGTQDCSSGLRCVYPTYLAYPDGTRLDFEYDEASAGDNTTRLRSVVSSRGYAMLFEYGGGGGGPQQISRACVVNMALGPKPWNNVCPANALATSTYTYTMVDKIRLASATDAGGGTSGYSYTQNGYVLTMAFRRPGESAPWLTNSFVVATGDEAVNEVVHSQVFADGQTYSYDFDDLSVGSFGSVNGIAGGSYAHNGRTTVVRYGLYRLPNSMWVPPSNPMDPTPYENFGQAPYQLTAGPIEVIDPLGRRTTYDYCDPSFLLPPNEQGQCVVGRLQSFTDPEGRQTRLSYDVYNHPGGVRRIAAPQPGQPTLPDLVTNEVYGCSTPKTCVQPTSITDANNNTTTRTYSPDHGGVLTSTGPAVNGIQPQTRYEYAQRYAWVANSSGGGGYVNVTTPIWLLVRERFCRTTAASGQSCAGGAADEVVTDYDYGPNSGPNNLLLRGQTVTSVDNGVTTVLRTCYGYDALGRRISETQPNANLSACP